MKTLLILVRRPDRGRLMAGRGGWNGPEWLYHLKLRQAGLGPDYRRRYPYGVDERLIPPVGWQTPFHRVELWLALQRYNRTALIVRRTRLAIRRNPMKRTHIATITGGGPNRTDAGSWSWSCTCGEHREDIPGVRPDYSSSDQLDQLCDFLPGHP